MCSIGEDDFGDEGGQHAMLPQVEEHLHSLLQLDGACKKCGQPGELYKLPRREPECRACFLLYVRHKFRAALGASKALPRNASVLVIFDGSAAAMVLLDMIRHAQEENSFKRLHCSVRVLCIDEQPFSQSSGTEHQQLDEHILQLRRFLERYEGLEAFVLPLGSTVKQLPYSLSAVAEYLKRDRTAERLFIERVRTIRSLTSRQDYLKLKRNEKISLVAKRLKCDFVFMPVISTQLAVDLLSAVALGRGGSAALDVALTDSRLGDGLKLLRPLRDLSQSEVQLYLHAQQLTSLQLPRLYDQIGGASSLQNITKAFVDNLQLNYGSTVSTIYRTGNKIAPNQDLQKDLEALKLDANNSEKMRTTCTFCHSALDCTGSSTLLAVRFSRFVSQLGDNAVSPEQYANAKQWTAGSEDSEELSGLCHGCRNIQRDCEDNLFALD